MPVTFDCRLVASLVLLLLRGNDVMSSSQLRVFTAEPTALNAARAAYAGDSLSDASLVPAIDQLLSDADAALVVTPPAVTDKTHRTPSGDPHDFISFPPYCWPDPVTGDCVHHDGLINPHAEDDSDGWRLWIVKNCTQALALAYYVTGNGTYGCAAATFLRVFFLNGTTKMNPNLNFGQIYPHQKLGRSQGLIRARLFVEIVDAVGLLDGSSCWSASDQAGMRDWMESYLDWLLTSPLGREEHLAANNHGTFYDTQVAAISLFVGQTDRARRVLANATVVRFDLQIEPDGRQPLELKRTLSLHYSVFNTEGLSNLAFLGRNVGVDLWGCGSDCRPDERGRLLAALELLAPYVVDGSVWPLEQIAPFNRVELAAVLMRDAPRFPKSRRLAVALAGYEREVMAVARERLLFVTQPLSDGAATSYALRRLSDIVVSFFVAGVLAVLSLRV